MTIHLSIKPERPLPMQHSTRRPIHIMRCSYPCDVPTRVLYLPMQCTGEAGESLDLSLQGQGFLIVLVLDHPLRRLHHLSERDLPRVSQHHPEHVVVLP